MIFNRRKKQPAESPVEPDETLAAEEADEEAAEEAGEPDEPDHSDEPESDDLEDVDEAESVDAKAEVAADLDVEALDEAEWRADGPYDVTEVGLDVADDDGADEETADDETAADPTDGNGNPRIDLGSMLVTGFAGAELRLQVSEESQQVVSVMLISGDSAIELGAYAAPRTGGFWPELRDELIESATEAGGSAALVEGPFGVELRRLLPVTTPDGEQGYQPSRMWVVEGPRWLLRGILYGQAALEDGVDGPVAPLITAFKQVIVRRDAQAMAPGDLLPLELPKDLTAAEA